VTTIDARRWRRPPHHEVRRLVEATGLSQQEVGRRLGIGARRVRHWLAEDADFDGRRISFVEWRALLDLVPEAERRTAERGATG
jgi:hypothetical protein